MNCHKDGHDSEDPKQSTADMTAFVQRLLQQMQSRFQTMSDSIVSKNIHTISSVTSRFRALLCLHTLLLLLVAIFVIKNASFFLCFLDFNALDEMGNRVDELEKSIDELRAEMGVEGSPSPLAPSKVMTEEGSA
ncbi:dol-P-Man:Man(5)GlcNAc(2)-PP-Dol alpha-1,3-mannosyltransferase [Salix suchowensis]|nr:dol-P-Man:Man(5)GlcNAc(2)-PP-Dol alpha-1,3-mannosyltransferase [Salix suchowensis]